MAVESVWPRTLCPCSPPSGHGRGLPRHISRCMPGVDQACKRILPPLPGWGQYSLWCGWDSLAWPRPKTRCCGGIMFLVCVVLYSTWMTMCHCTYIGCVFCVYHVTRVLKGRTISNLIVLELLFWINCTSVQNSVVVCVFLRACVWCLRAKFGFSAGVNSFGCRASFWPGNRMFGELSEMLWICVYCCADMRRSFKKCVLAIEKNCNIWQCYKS